MYRRVVAAVSLALFALVALIAVIVTDLHDRSLPQALGARAAVSLDFSGSPLSDEEAFAELGERSDALGLGLVKVAPDLGGDQSGQVFVTLGTTSDLAGSVLRFGGQPDARVEPSTALAHSFASGDYLITGAGADRDAFASWLEHNRVDARWADDSVAATLMLVVRETSFATALVAAAVLAIALALFWLSVRARGRALRVLAGVGAQRIGTEDIGGFVVAVLAGAVLADVIAAVAVGASQGWVFAPYYVKVLAVFGAVVLAGSAVAAVVMSAASWPTADVLATRRPAAGSLRGVSGVLEVLVFTLVVSAAAPAAAAYSQARQTADQQATWHSLSSEVALSFPSALGEDGFVQLMPAVGDLVADAEANDAVALSYTWTADPASGVALDSVGDVALINQTWLDLMVGRGSPANMSDFEPLTAGQLPPGVRDLLEPSLQLWSRTPVAGSKALAAMRFYRYRGAEPIPMATAGGGDLRFLTNAVIALAPNLHETFNDNFLASVASSRNLVFAGLEPTLTLVQQHGLTNKVDVRYVAEQGVLQAQYTAYFAWLRAASLLALVVALTTCAAVAALITALLRAKRDLPLRLAGRPWREILAGRITREWLVGLAITALVVLWQGSGYLGVVAAVAALALLVSPAAHLVAARWSFANLTRRAQ